MIYIKLDARFVAPPPYFTLCLKRPLRQYWLISVKCYSDKYLGAIQIELTMLTTLITEGSAKQLVITILFTGITMIRLIGDGNVFYVSPAHSEILNILMEYYLGESCFNIKKIGKDV